MILHSWIFVTATLLSCGNQKTSESMGNDLPFHDATKSNMTFVNHYITHHFRDFAFMKPRKAFLFLDLALVSLRKIQHLDDLASRNPGETRHFSHLASSGNVALERPGIQRWLQKAATLGWSCISSSLGNETIQSFFIQEPLWNTRLQRPRIQKARLTPEKQRWVLNIENDVDRQKYNLVVSRRTWVYLMHASCSKSNWSLFRGNACFAYRPPVCWKSISNVKPPAWLSIICFDYWKHHHHWNDNMTLGKEFSLLKC